MENQALVLDLVEWVAKAPRPYAAVMEAWRTSCPRLTIWEDTVEAGLVTTRPDPEHGTVVTVTEAGRVMLHREGRLTGR